MDVYQISATAYFVTQVFLGYYAPGIETGMYILLFSKEFCGLLAPFFFQIIYFYFRNLLILVHCVVCKLVKNNLSFSYVA